LSTHFPLSALFVCTTSITFLFFASAFPTAAAAGISVQVDPRTGDDSRCNTTFICRTIAHAVQLVGVSQVNLSAGVFNESTVSIDNVSYFVVSGVPSSTFFDCSRRLGPTTGAAFNINNSTVTITGIMFQHCSNSNGNGGAVSAVDSSVAVSQCSFVNCSAANGGAMSATGGGGGMFLRVEDSTFSGNAAVGGLIGCPTGSQSSEPCSTWGGAIAAFEILNVSVTGCSMTDNTAVADVPMASPQSDLSRNAVAGGGCVSVLFRWNCSAFVLHMSGNSFLRCAVHVSRSRKIVVGNGYGGALSVYVGLSAGLQPLSVSFFTFSLHYNMFANCVVSGDVEGGNAYGGGVSLYIGGYSSVFSSNVDAVAAVGDTVVRNVSVTLHSARFESCSATRNGASTFGANVYGGSFSFYVGAYTWSRSGSSGNSSSTCGTTDVSAVVVRVQNASSVNSSASTLAIGGTSRGANSYGGSMSVLYAGAYAWSRTEAASSSSSSMCGAMSASGVSVHVSDSACWDCRALSSGGFSYGANSYGGSMSVLYIGAYAWSRNNAASSSSSSSICGVTSASGVLVHVSDSACSNCIALSTSRFDSFGAISYGGSISASFIGASSYSYATGEFRFSSSAVVEATLVHRLSITIKNSTITDTLALSETAGISFGSNVYGGAISVMVGPHVWSFIGTGSSNASCGDTICKNCRVFISGTSISNSRAVSNSSGGSNGAFVYGGGVSFVVHPYVWSSSSFRGGSSASAGSTIVTGLLAVFLDCNFSGGTVSTRTIKDGFRVAASGSDAIGGAVAVVVGVYMTNSYGPLSSGYVSSGRISVQDSVVEFSRNRVTNCAAVSVTDTSFGLSSVFGGAFAMLHSPQVSNFKLGLLLPSVGVLGVSGFNVTALISQSRFFQCSVFSNSSSARPGVANGGGGAVYARSEALTNFSVTESMFNISTVIVASGTTGLPSYSSGGALAVEAGDSKSSFVAISSSSFFNCAVQGANIANMGVLGGAAHVFRVAHISVVRTNFTNCSVIDADSDALTGNIVSGGSAMSAVVTGNMFVLDCVFDASAGQDASQTSTGLLVLARNSSNALASVSNCEFISSTVVLRVQCVGDDGVRRLAGSCVGPNIALTRSKIQQIPSQAVSDINTTGNLLAFQGPVSFTGSRMRCALPRFAAFKTQAGGSSTSSTVYSCRPCPPFQISLAATEVLLDELSALANVDQCFFVSPNAPSTTVCPFAVADCTTFVFVSRGFWTNVSESGTLNTARRCPRGYCGCSSGNRTCPLPPLISIDRNRDPLCNGNRVGKLCGGCPPNFTQSMDDATCISNQACSNNLWWVWTLSILGFAVYSLYIVVSCRKSAVGAFSCVVLYFQMSSFAENFAANTDARDGLVTILEFAQVHSVAAMYQGACYAPSMSAYNATAFKLIGPLLVLLFAVVWTWFIQKLQPRLQQRNIDLSVSYSGTLAVTVLFVFSNVSSVVFTLVECSSYSGSDAVVFIDGTVPCKDVKWGVLVFIAALLFLFPAAFAVALRLKNIPPSARDAVCGKYSGPMFYWGAVTLSFRLLISVAQFLRVDYPNLMAFVRSSLSMGVLVLLVHLRPYVHERTFWVDVACYVCLTAQFGLQTFATTRDFLGVAESSDSRVFFTSVSTWSTVIRFLPVGVFATAWLNTKFHFGNALNDIWRQIAVLINRVTPRFEALVHKAKCCFRRTEQGPSSREMRTERRSDADDLKRSLIA
jgi:hypothetical protein